MFVNVKLVNDAEITVNTDHIISVLDYLMKRDCFLQRFVLTTTAKDEDGSNCAYNLRNKEECDKLTKYLIEAQGVQL